MSRKSTIGNEKSNVEFYMKTKAWILSLVTYVVLSAGLTFLFDWIWPDNRVRIIVVPLVVGGS